MSAVRWGAAVAAVVAGPPLYTLVQAGQLEWTAALEKGGVVALGCALGATAVARLASGYERDGERRKRLDAADRAIADAQGIVHEGRTIPAPQPGTGT